MIDSARQKVTTCSAMSRRLATRPMRAEVGCQGSREQVWTAKIDFQGTVPNLGGQRVEVGEGNPNVPRGIVDQHVHPAERPHHPLDCGVDGHWITLVELYGQALSSHRLHRIDHRGSPFQVAEVWDGDIRTRSSQGSGNRTAKIPSATGDQGGLPLEIRRVFLYL